MQPTWQETFDRWFPEGAVVTVVDDVPEDPDATSFVCPRVLVYEDAAQPTLKIICPGVKVSYAENVTVEDYGSTETFIDKLITSAVNGQQYRLTSVVELEAKKQAAILRQDEVYA